MDKTLSVPEGLVTADKVATHLSMAEGTIRNMANRGEIPSVKIGRALRFRLSDIDAWVRSRQAAAA